MRRRDLQGFAQSKLDDAVLMLQHQRWSSAYYLAGYAVEFALKACIARQVASETIPDKAFLRDVFSHKFPELVGLAGLRLELRQAQDGDPDFASYWAIVLEWTPDVRYSGSGALEAQLLAQAVGEPEHGVLQWIRRFW